jgi:hypothetical protein
MMARVRRQNQLDMKPSDLDPDDVRLGTLLCESRSSPSLPPRFQENVWRRIEQGEVKPKVDWLDLLASWLLRPRLAVAVAAVLVLTGLGLGWNNGERQARNDAQARYLATVAPNALH